MAYYFIWEKDMLLHLLYTCCLMQTLWCFASHATEKADDFAPKTIYIELDLKTCSPIQVLKLKQTAHTTYSLEKSDAGEFYISNASNSVVLNPDGLMLDFYKLKLFSERNSSRSETLLEVKINSKNKKVCTRETNNIAKKSKIKFLFADSILSYDFHNMWLDEEVSSNVFTVNFAENILVDSFICYVLVKSNSEVDVNGNDEAMFRLEKVNSGSSQLLLSTDKTKQAQQQHYVAPVLNLYLLKLARALDRERMDAYELEFSILNENSASTVLKIAVTDVNDNAPVFNQTSYKFELSENNPRRLCFGTLSASDPDLGRNSLVKYAILNSSLITYRSVDEDGHGKQVYQIG